MEITNESTTLNPVLWGPFFWPTMDAVAVVYDPSSEDSKESTLIFFFSLQGVIPCFECREHYCRYFETYPIREELDTRAGLFRWVHRLKNSVQEKLSRPTLSFEDYILSIEKRFQVTLHHPHQ